MQDKEWSGDLFRHVHTNVDKEDHKLGDMVNNNDAWSPRLHVIVCNLLLFVLPFLCIFARTEHTILTGFGNAHHLAASCYRD